MAEKKCMIDPMFRLRLFLQTNYINRLIADCENVINLRDEGNSIWYMASQLALLCQHGVSLPL